MQSVTSRRPTPPPHKHTHDPIYINFILVMCLRVSNPKHGARRSIPTSTSILKHNASCQIQLQEPLILSRSHGQSTHICTVRHHVRTTKSVLSRLPEYSLNTLMLFSWFSSSHRKCVDSSFKQGKGGKHPVTAHMKFVNGS